MKIIISNLADGEHKYEFVENLDFFEITDFRSDEQIKIEVTLNKMYRQLFLKIIISGNVIYNCDRCLDDFKTKIENSFDVVYKLSKEEFDDDKSDNIFYIGPETNSIDIKDIVREYILLAVPMRRVPEEKDGVCVVCNRNIEELLKKKSENEINPVWDKLLKNNNKNKN